MDHRQIRAIREALNQEWVLGREDFKDKIERMSKRQVRPGQSGRPRVEEDKPYIMCSSILAESVF
jgi:hypothetical protein